MGAILSTLAAGCFLGSLIGAIGDTIFRSAARDAGKYLYDEAVKPAAVKAAEEVPKLVTQVAESGVVEKMNPIPIGKYVFEGVIKPAYDVTVNEVPKAATGIYSGLEKLTSIFKW